MWMWIILGVLAAVVLGIITVMSILDRKKAKKTRAEKVAFNQEVLEARFKIASEVLALIAVNKQKLAKFVPSVGAVKMAHIKEAAREELKSIENSRSFKLANEEFDDDQTLKMNFMALKKLNSNLWATKGKKNIAFFEKLLKQEKDILAANQAVTQDNKKRGFFKKTAKAKK